MLFFSFFLSLIFPQNKNFLTFNKQATGEILAAIMADYYDNLEI